MTNRCAYCQADPNDPGKCIEGGCETCCNCGREIYDPDASIHIPPKSRMTFAVRRVDLVVDPLRDAVIEAAKAWLRSRDPRGMGFGSEDVSKADLELTMAVRALQEVSDE
jgi:hypothetical protein